MRTTPEDRLPAGCACQLASSPVAGSRNSGPAAGSRKSNIPAIVPERSSKDPSPIRPSPPVVLNEREDRRLPGQGAADVVDPRVRGDHQFRHLRTEPAAVLVAEDRGRCPAQARAGERVRGRPGVISPAAAPPGQNCIRRSDLEPLGSVGVVMDCCQVLGQHCPRRAHPGKGPWRKYALISDLAGSMVLATAGDPYYG